MSADAAPLDLVEELLGICGVFDAAQIDYAVCGGIALAIHGLPRMTKDIDVLLRPQDLERALAAVAARRFVLEGGRFTFRTGTPGERVMYRVSKAIGSRLITLDLLLSGPEHDMVWGSRQSVSYRGRKVTVVSRDGLIAMKRAAGRPQDLVDIDRLASPDDRGDRA